MMFEKSVKWCAMPVNIPGISARDYEKETAFQIYCADWLRKQWEITKDERYRHWHHSANEAPGGHRAGLIAKLMGQAKGFPDFISCRLRVAIELKIPGGMPSKEQVHWMNHFIDIGWKAEVIYNFERFREVVLNQERVSHSEP